MQELRMKKKKKKLGKRVVLQHTLLRKVEFCFQAFFIHTHAYIFFLVATTPQKGSSAPQQETSVLFL